MPSRPSTLSLSEAIDEFLQWLELDRHASAHTVVAYRDDLRRFSAFADTHGEPDRPIDAVDRDLIRAFQRSVSRAQTGRPGNRRPLSPATRQRRLIALRMFLRFAQREEWLTADLASTVDLPRLAERLPKPLEDYDRGRLIEFLGADTLPAKRDKAFILLLLSSGARISEILQLDRADWGHERLVLRGKGDRERTAMVTAGARGAVDDYLAARDDPSPALFISFQPATAGADTNRLTPKGARHVCAELARRIGMRRFHPHQLRHTLGTLLQEELGDARLTAETLGHTGLASVAGYTKITANRRQLAQERVEQAGL
jgi:site-specific recombinase XerD